MVAYVAHMVKRTYSNGQIVVHWDSERCIHTGWCAKGYPEVFDTSRRPWVLVDGADTDQIVNTIETCPSGALSYERLDGGPQEVADVPTTVIPWPNGPYFVRGEFEVRDRHGDVFVDGPRATLCRCGQSKNHPFCDLSHRTTGFRSYPRAISPDRSEAEAPTDIGVRFEEQ